MREVGEGVFGDEEDDEGRGGSATAGAVGRGGGRCVSVERARRQVRPKGAATAWRPVRNGRSVTVEEARSYRFKQLTMPQGIIS